MKRFEKGSCVLEGVTIGINSLKEKDTKFKKNEPEYNCIVPMPKNDPQYVDLITLIKEILAEKNLKIKQLKADKFPIKDGDKIYEENYKGTDKGETLKGTYQIKFGTKFDFKVFDCYGKILDKTKVSWMGSKVDLQFTPSFYINEFGQGIKLNLVAIMLIDENKFETDAPEAVFNFSPPENKFEDVDNSQVNNNTNVDDDDELPF